MPIIKDGTGVFSFFIFEQYKLHFPSFLLYALVKCKQTSDLFVCLFGHLCQRWPSDETVDVNVQQCWGLNDLAWGIMSRLDSSVDKLKWCQFLGFKNLERDTNQNHPLTLQLYETHLIEHLNSKTKKDSFSKQSREIIILLTSFLKITDMIITAGSSTTPQSSEQSSASSPYY